MLKKITFFLLGILLSSGYTFSQRLDHDLTSPFFLGFNVGGTTHHTDVKSKLNAGGGFVFGGTFNRDYGNFFSYDLKFRYLGGVWKGQNTSFTSFNDYENSTLSSLPTDYKTTYGNSINNFRTVSNEFNLELSLHLNRLTERTGLDPYIFGGLGATFFYTKGNLLNKDELIYDYNQLNDYSQSSLKNFMDNTYESDLDGSKLFDNLELMGHVGFGLGYYFTRNFSMGFEHKTTLTGGDRFDGVFSNHGKPPFNGIFSTPGVNSKDIYHYTSIYFKFYLNSRHETEHVNNTTPPTTPTNPAGPSTPIECPQPSIKLLTPKNSTVSQPTFQINGVIKNVNSQGITANHNGIQAGDFILNNRDEVKGTFHLQPGLNTIILTATNNCGTVEETIYVNYVPACDAPTVNFISPNTTSISTTNPSISIQAQIKNLGDGLVQLYLNGQQTSNFSYNNGILTSTLALQNGNNSIQIVVSNSCGTNSQSISVEYNVLCPRPIVSVSNQSINYVTTNRVEVLASIQNITNTNQVDVYLNGTKQSVGTYNVNNSNFTKGLSLNLGQNTVLIRATNGCGTNEQTIIYDYGKPCVDPTVSITNPSGSRVTSTNATFTVQATIKNVTNPQNIIFKVNNVVNNNYNYNTQTGLLTANVQLGNGSNYIDLYVSNECGAASTSTTISYIPPCEKPVITLKQPTSNITVTSSTYDLEVFVQNINNQNDISLTVNDVIQSQGSYYTNTKVYRKQIKLQKGNNFIHLLATNNCGENSTLVNIFYKEENVIVEEKPVVLFTTSCGIKVEAGLVKFEGTVYGVTSTSQIQVKLQNVIQQSTVFKKIGNGYSFEFEMRAAYSQTYVLEVSATNSSGVTSSTCQITTNDAPIIDKDLIICLTSNNVKQTLIIKESEWLKYQRLGATLGECPQIVDKDMVICYIQNGQKATLTIKESEWPQFQRNGATQGACPQAVDNDIVICMTEGLTKVTKTIKESQWRTYQQLGATLGECPQIIDNDIIICLPQNRSKVTMTIKESQWPTYQAQGATLGECPIFDPEIKICLRQNGTLKPLTIKQSEWPTYQAQGAILGECPVIIDNDITICVKEGSKNKTIIIKQSQWPTYQAQGATLGVCPVIDNDIVICINNGAKRETKTIKESQWATYQAQGATLGECPVVIDKDIKICAKRGESKVTMTIKESEWPTYQAQGATLGECPVIVDKNIQVCVPQGKTKTTMTIKESQWPIYQAQGATLGECPIDNDIKICTLQGNTRVTMTIKESEWPTFQRSGATLGECPVVIDKDIKICTKRGESKVTITIKESQWPTYQAQGATLGECPLIVDKFIQVCVPQGKTKTTMTIKESQWPTYQAQGATLGDCPIDKDMKICTLQGNSLVTMTIKESEWPTFQNSGATIGECPVDKDIQICTLQGRTKVTMTIKESQWPTYQAQGATLGACPVFDPEITICLSQNGKLTNVTIKQSEWPAYQSRGATIGECPTIIDKDIQICIPEGNTKVTKTIKESEWSTYQNQGATLGECVNLNYNKEKVDFKNNTPISFNDLLICVQENGKYVTKTIKVTEWNKYERLGATKGACVETNGQTNPKVVEGGEIKQNSTPVNTRINGRQP